jgi:hypothetical protein
MISLLILAFLFIAYIIFLWVTQPKPMKCNVIYAGKKNDYGDVTVKSVRDVSKFAITDQFENKINPANYQKYIVAGNSMVIAGIREDDLVLVDEITDYKNIKADNVIALKYEIDNDKSALKLRKKIACIDYQENFDEWFNNLIKHYTIQADKEYIKEKYDKCIKKYHYLINDTRNITFLFSSTFHIEENRIDYSFHPAEFLFGVVKYVIRGN